MGRPDAYDAQGQVFFTMKLVKGQTLGTVFDELHRQAGGWTRARVLGLILRVCEAMSYAHAKGVIHRDLKPANVMVGKFGEVYVMDWGLAKILGRTDEKDIRIRPQPTTSDVRSDRQDHATPDSPIYTMDGDIVGTPAYMPPEQASGRIWEMGPHSDVYAVGAMLYQLLAGHVPYLPPGNRMNNHALLVLVQTSPPADIDEVAPKAPADLRAICEKAIARDIAERYASMTQLSQDLQAYLEGGLISVHRHSVSQRLRFIAKQQSLASRIGAAVGFGGSLAHDYLTNVNYTPVPGREGTLVPFLEKTASLVAPRSSLWEASNIATWTGIALLASSLILFPKARHLPLTAGIPLVLFQLDLVSSLGALGAFVLLFWLFALAPALDPDHRRRP